MSLTTQSDTSDTSDGLCSRRDFLKHSGPTVAGAMATAHESALKKGELIEVPQYNRV